jgi:hypothetical protein
MAGLPYEVQRDDTRWRLVLLWGGQSVPELFDRTTCVAHRYGVTCGSLYTSERLM